jgi:hypothetical protein
MGVSKMAVIIVRCPKTRKDILPGIEIAAADFRSIPSAPSRVKCPVCGEEHAWLPYAGRVAEAFASRFAKAPSISSPDETSGPLQPEAGRGNAES